MATSAKDLPDNATHEQIEEFVNDLMKPEEPKQELEQKTEEEEPKQEETSVSDETPADDEPVAEEKGDEEEESEWLTEELRAKASAYGLSDEDIADFANREELDRSLVFLTRLAMKEGQEALKDGKDEPEEEVKPKRGPDGRFVPRKKEPEEQKPLVSSDYKVSLSPDEYDEAVIKEFGALRDHYESKFQKLEERLELFEQIEAEREEEALQTQFDALVDSLDHKDLFGETDRETDEQLANRKKLFDRQRTLIVGLQRRGLSPRLDKALLEEAMNAAFFKEMMKKERKSLTRKLSSQSNLRMGDSQTKASETKPTLEDEMEQLYKELEAQTG